MSEPERVCPVCNGIGSVPPEQLVARETPAEIQRRVTEFLAGIADIRSNPAEMELLNTLLGEGMKAERAAEFVRAGRELAMYREKFGTQDRAAE